MNKENSHFFQKLMEGQFQQLLIARAENALATHPALLAATQRLAHLQEQKRKLEDDIGAQTREVERVKEEVRQELLARISGGGGGAVMALAPLAPVEDIFILPAPAPSPADAGREKEHEDFRVDKMYSTFFSGPFDEILLPDVPHRNLFLRFCHEHLEPSETHLDYISIDRIEEVYTRWYQENYPDGEVEIEIYDFFPRFMLHSTKIGGEKDPRVSGGPRYQYWIVTRIRWNDECRNESSMFEEFPEKCRQELDDEILEATAQSIFHRVQATGALGSEVTHRRQRRLTKRAREEDEEEEEENEDEQDDHFSINLDEDEDEDDEDDDNDDYRDDDDDDDEDIDEADIETVTSEEKKGTHKTPINLPLDVHLLKPFLQNLRPTYEEDCQNSPWFREHFAHVINQAGLKSARGWNTIIEAARKGEQLRMNTVGLPEKMMECGMCGSKDFCAFRLSFNWKDFYVGQKCAERTRALIKFFRAFFKITKMIKAFPANCEFNVIPAYRELVHLRDALAKAK